MVTIVNNDIVTAEIRVRLERIIIEEIGDSAGEWMAHIHEESASLSWHIRLVAPDGQMWQKDFFGPVEQDDKGNFVRNTIREAVRIFKTQETS